MRISIIFLHLSAMKPNILVLYYSQTGQLREILDSLFSLEQQNCHIDFIEIKPVKPFPFPWTADTFFNCMPECVQQIEEEIHPIQYPRNDYDLVVLGYQPWFLSPSIPFNSFLKSPYAAILRGKPVITVVGSRNMWLNAQEKTKQALKELGGRLVGHIALFDRNPNLASVLSIVRWSFKGQKEASRFLPAAGVQQQDIDNCKHWGPTISSHLKAETLDLLHPALLAQKSVELSKALVILEQRAIKNFRKFSLFILEKGNREDPNRKKRVKLFQRLLFVGVFILSPISSLTASIAVLFNSRKLEEQVQYFKNIDYRENAI